MFCWAAVVAQVVEHRTTTQLVMSSYLGWSLAFSILSLIFKLFFRTMAFNIFVKKGHHSLGGEVKTWNLSFKWMPSNAALVKSGSNQHNICKNLQKVRVSLLSQSCSQETHSRQASHKLLQEKKLNLNLAGFVLWSLQPVLDEKASATSRQSPSQQYRSFLLMAAIFLSKKDWKGANCDNNHDSFIL